MPKISFYILLTIVFTAGIVRADGTWTGAVDSSWNTVGNWNPAAVPTGKVTIPYVTTNSLDFNSTATLSEFIVKDRGTVTTISGGTLTLSGSYLRVGFGSSTTTTGDAPTLNITGGTVNANGGISLSTNNAAGGSDAVLNISGKDTKVNVGGYFANASGYGNGTVNVYDGTVNVTGTALWIGTRNVGTTSYKGTLNILGGTFKTTTGDNRISGDSTNGIGLLNIGDAAGRGNGTMIVTGTLKKGDGSATLTMNSGTLRVGTASFSGVTTNYYGGTFQANTYTGTYFSNIGTSVEIAKDASSDVRSIGTMTINAQLYQQVKYYGRDSVNYRGGVKSSLSFDVAKDGTADKLTVTGGKIKLEAGSLNLYTPAVSTLTANTSWKIIDGTFDGTRKANFIFMNRSSADNMNWAFNSSTGMLTYVGKLTELTSWSGPDLTSQYTKLTSAVDLNGTNKGTLTDSIVVIGKNGVLNLNSGSRLKVLATNNIAAALYLEDGGRINFKLDNLWAGPSSQDASFIMTGGELNFGTSTNTGLIAKGGTVIFTGGKAGNLSGTTLQAGGRIHLNAADGDENSHMIVDGTANLYLGQMDFGYQDANGSALLEVKGGTLKTTTLNIGIDRQLSNTSNYEMIVSGGKMVVTSSVGGYNSDYFVMTLKGGTLDLPSLTTNSNLKLNLLGGTLMLDSVTGDLVNNGSDVQITSGADAAASTAGKMTVSGKYIQNEGSLNLDVDSTGKADTMTASSFEFNGGSVNVNYAYTGTDAQSWTFLTGNVTAMNADVTLNTNVPLAGNRKLTYADGTLTLSSLPDSSTTWTGSDLNGQYASIAEKTININEDAEIANSVIALGDGAVLNVASGVDANFTADTNLLASLYVNDGGELNIGHAQGTGTTSVANLYQASGSTVNLYSDVLKVGSYTAAAGSTLNLKSGTFQANQFTGDLTNTASNVELDGAMTISGKYTQKLNGSLTFDLADGDKISATSLDLSTGTLYVNKPSTLTDGQSWDIMDGTVSNRRANFVFQNRTSADNMNWSFDSTSGELKYVGKLTDSSSTWAGANLNKQYVKLTKAVALDGTNKGEFTDSTLVIASGGKLTLKDGSRLKIISSSNVAAAMYLEDGGQIIVNNTTKTGVWFGPSSKDTTFYMTGGSMNLGGGESQGFIINDGSAFITGGKVGKIDSSGNLSQGGMIHVSGSKGSNQNSHLTIGGTAEVNVTTLQLGYYTEDPSGSLDITGGKVTVGTLRISSQNSGNDSRNYVARISGGEVNVTNLYVGTQKNGSLALTGGSLKAGEFTLGGNGTFDLLGGMFQAKTYSGSFVNDGATILVDEKMAIANGDFTQDSGRIEINITSSDVYDVIQADQFDLNGGDLYLKFAEGFETSQVSQKFDVFDGMLNYIAENFQVLTEGLGKQYSVSFTTDGLFINNLSGSGVPEPATWVLLLLGLVGLGAAKRMRQ